MDAAGHQRRSIGGLHVHPPARPRWRKHRSLCISAIITDEDNENPKHVCLAATELPPGKSAVNTVETIEYTMKEITEKYEMYLGYCVQLGIDVFEFQSLKVLKGSLLRRLQLVRLVC